jgi:hypothetical protein
LTINPTTNNTTTASACGSYTWSVDGQTYTTSGTYTSTTGCNVETLDINDLTQPKEQLPQQIHVEDLILGRLMAKRIQQVVHTTIPQDAR